MTRQQGQHQRRQRQRIAIPTRRPGAATAISCRRCRRTTSCAASSTTAPGCTACRTWPAPARLPAANWIAQIAKCRASITGEDGLEPTYRSGGQINVNTQPANAIEALLTACQGRLSEIGGFYKIHLGAPDSPTFSWTDADLLSTEQQIYRPFFSLADSVNGIQGTYPSPDEGWETATAPPLYRTDLEVRDGNRRLMAAPQFDFVPYPRAGAAVAEVRAGGGAARAHPCAADAAGLLGG